MTYMVQLSQGMADLLLITSVSAKSAIHVGVNENAEAELPWTVVRALVFRARVKHTLKFILN